MADASGLVDHSEQNGDELQSSLSSPQNVLDSEPATEVRASCALKLLRLGFESWLNYCIVYIINTQSADQSPEFQEVLSPPLTDTHSEADAEVQVKDAASASEDLSTPEEASSSLLTDTPNSPPNLVPLEEDVNEEEVEERTKTEQSKEEAEEETKREERKEEAKERTQTEEKKEEAEGEERSEGLKEEVEKDGKSEGRKENEWLDVLGSGQLLKKVRGSCLC